MCQVTDIAHPTDDADGGPPGDSAATEDLMASQDAEMKRMQTHLEQQEKERSRRSGAGAGGAGRTHPPIAAPPNIWPRMSLRSTAPARRRRPVEREEGEQRDRLAAGVALVSCAHW